jgi:hypothetical protein
MLAAAAWRQMPIGECWEARMRKEEQPQEAAEDEIGRPDYAAIRERLRQGSITPEDLRVLEGLVEEVERASKALRAAMVE